VKGTLTEVRPGVWRVRVYVGRDGNGRPVQVSRSVHGGKRDAQTALAKLVTEVHTGLAMRTNATIARLLDRWLDHISRDRTAHTVHNYRLKIEKHIKPALGSVRIDRLTAERLDQQYRIWLDRGLSPSTVHMFHAILSAALRQAVRWGWLDRAPTQQASPPAQARSQARSVSPEDLQRLVAAAEADDPLVATAIALAALTGCRRGELCALRWSDVDLTTGVLRVSRSYSIVNGQRIVGDTKTHQGRTLALDAVAIEVLRHRWAFQRWYAGECEVSVVADAYVLSREADGTEPLAPNGLTHAFARMCRRLGMDYHFHEMRHFTATTSIAAGADIRTVATRLGHADPSTTLRIYAHAIEARDRDVANILGKALRPQLEP